MTADHCIERIRQDLVCHANTAVWIPQWSEHSYHPDGMIMRTNAQTQCVDWERLDEWAKERVLVAGEYRLKEGPFTKAKEGKE